MALNPNPKFNRLVDIDLYEEPSFSYTVPPEAETLMDNKIEVGYEQTLHVRVEVIYEPYYVVDFGLNHFLSAEHEYNRTGAPVDVARIDCKENSVHKHQFFLHNAQEKTVWHDFSNETCDDDCVKIINGLYDRAYSEMIENADTHYTDWRGR